MALEDRIELDISEALRSIDTIEDSLTGATQAFKVGIAEALDLLSTVAIQEVDATAVTVGIDEAVSAANLDPELSVDASPITTAIDDAVGAADTEVPLGVDPSAIPGAIADAIDGVDTSIQLDAITDGITEEINAAIADADTTVDLEVDTAAAEQGLSGIAAAGAGAEEGVQGTSDAMGALQGASQLAAGDLAGVGATLGAVSARGSALATVGLLLAGAFSAATGAALESDTAQRRYNVALGDFAGRIDSLSIPGFAADLEELAEATGNSDESMRLAAARLFDFGESSGQTRAEVAATTEQILLLATRAAVLNPTLGDAGAVADQLTGALARGGRTLIDFGLAITPAEIEARALADNMGKASEELTVYDRAAAGAAIATERLGQRLRDDISANADQPILTLRRLREEFGNALEVFGAPLLEPLIDSLEAGQPILIDFAQTFGELASVALPLVVQGLQAVQPAFAVTADLLQLLLAVLGPVIGLIDSIPDPVLAAVAAAVAFNAVLGPLTSGISFLIGRLALSGGLAGAFTGLLGPIGLVSAALGIGIGIITSYNAKKEEQRQKIQEVADAFLDEAAAIDSDIEALVRKRAADENQEDDLRRIGLSVREFAQLASEGRAGFLEFVDALVAAGEVTPGVGQALRLTGGDLGQITVALREAGVSAIELAESNPGLIQSFTELAAETQEAAKASLTKLVNDEKLTDAAAKAAIANTRSADGTNNYVAALRSVAPTSEAATGATEDYTRALADQPSAYADAQQGLNDLIDSTRSLLDAEISAQEAHLRLGDAMENVAQTGARRMTEQLEAETRAAEEAEQALNSLLDAQIGFLDSTIAAENAQRSFTEALEEVGTRQSQVTDAESQEAFADSVRAARDAALEAAKSELRLAEDRAKANGQTLTAAQRQEVFAAALQKVTEQASGPAIGAVLELLGTYNELPRDISTTIEVDTSQAQAAQDEYAQAVRDARDAALGAANADLELAQKRAEASGSSLTAAERDGIFRGSLALTAAQASGPTKTAIQELIGVYDTVPEAIRTRLEADATQALDEVKRLYAAVAPLLDFNLPLAGRFRPPGAMAGGTWTGPQWLEVGEAGRELVFVQAGTTATVVPNQRTEQMLGGGSSVGLDAASLAALQRLADQPRVQATIGSVVAPTVEAAHEVAFEAVRQLDAMAVRLGAGG